MKKISKKIKKKNKRKTEKINECKSGKKIKNSRSHCSERAGITGT
jgi:hypothetical protein